MLTRHFKKSALAATCIACVAMPAAVWASAPSLSKARPVAESAAAKMARQTHASSHKVTACRRGAASTTCNVELRFRTGASRCTVDVIVSRRAATSRLVWRPSNYRCF